MYIYNFGNAWHIMSNTNSLKARRKLAIFGVASYSNNHSLKNKISQLDDRFVYEIYYFPDARYSNQSDVLDLLDKLQPNAIINSSMDSSKRKIIDQVIKNNGYNHIYIN